MNFIEAVTALKEGECDAIKRKVMSFNYKAYDLGLNLGHDKIAFEHILAEDWELVNPIKQYEEVEIVRYLWINGDREGVCEKPVSLPSCEIIKLIGTRKAEIKPKVKHREKVGFATPTCYIVDSIPKNINCDLFAEWEE